MKITLKDGSVKEYTESKSVIDIAFDISEGLARAACAGQVDGQIVDLRTVIHKDCSLNILTARDPEGLRVVRHTCSHVLAEAVRHLFPNAKLAIGRQSTPASTMTLRQNHFPERTLTNWKKR